MVDTGMTIMILLNAIFGELTFKALLWWRWLLWACIAVACATTCLAWKKKYRWCVKPLHFALQSYFAVVTIRGYFVVDVESHTVFQKLLNTSGAHNGALAIVILSSNIMGPYEALISGCIFILGSFGFLSLNFMTFESQNTDITVNLEMMLQSPFLGVFLIHTAVQLLIPSLVMVVF